MPYMPGRALSPAIQQAIKDTGMCAASCQDTINHCLHMGGRHVAPEHMKLLVDCAEICDTTRNVTLRDSAFTGPMSAVCAETCQRCANSCAQFTDDTMMLDCAEVCRACSTSCQRVVESVGQAEIAAV